MNAIPQPKIGFYPVGKLPKPGGSWNNRAGERPTVPPHGELSDRAQRFLDEHQTLKYQYGAQYHAETRRLIYERAKLLFQAKAFTWSMDAVEVKNTAYATLTTQIHAADEALIAHLAARPGYTVERVRAEFGMMEILSAALKRDQPETPEEYD